MHGYVIFRAYFFKHVLSLVALQTGGVAADVVKDQMAAGEDATPQQRALRALGTATKGASTIGPVADNEIAKGDHSQNSL